MAHGSVADVLERADFGSLTGGLEAGVALRARVVAHDREVATLALRAQRLRVPIAKCPVGTVRPILIHARDVVVATVRPENLSARNVLSARVLAI